MMSVSRLSLLALATVSMVFTDRAVAQASPCGGIWQGCCGDDNTCTSTTAMQLTCAGDPAQCKPCGGEWQDCCGGVGGNCGDELNCTADGLCHPCGGEWQSCCGGLGGHCGGGLNCNDQAQCAPCGGPYEICCQVEGISEDCNTERCVGRHTCKDNTCRPCGGEYQGACTISSLDCDDNLVMNKEMTQCIKPAPM